MNWIFFALLSPAVYALVNFIDKHLVSNAVKDYRAMPIYTSIVAFISGTIFWAITGFPLLDLKDAVIVIFTGMLAIWSLFFYFKALADEETTTIIILFQMLPVLSLVFGYVILGETITLKQLIGFIFIIVAAIGISIKPLKKDAKIISSAFILILAYNVMWALSGVLVKFAINANSLPKIISFESWGIALGGLVVFLISPSIRKAFIKNSKFIKKNVFGILFFNEALFVLAKSLAFYAYILGAVALVSVLSSTQVFFGILYGFVLTKMFPKLFKEDISSKGLTKKIAFAVFVGVGILLLA